MYRDKKIYRESHSPRPRSTDPREGFSRYPDVGRPTSYSLDRHDRSGAPVNGFNIPVRKEPSADYNMAKREAAYAKHRENGNPRGGYNNMAYEYSDAPETRPKSWNDMYRSLPPSEASSHFSNNIAAEKRRSVQDSPAAKTHKQHWRDFFGAHDDDAESSNGTVKENPGRGFCGSYCFVTFRILVCLMIMCDLVFDWLITSSEPGDFMFIPNENNRVCNLNLDFHARLNLSLSEDICTTSKSSIWGALSIFSLISSVLAVTQVVNIAMEIIRKCSGKFGPFLHSQSEVFIILFLEEIPQGTLLAVFFFHCRCDATPFNTDARLFPLLSACISLLAAISRYCISFEKLSGNEGCCNQWWRCLCCRDPKYCCNIKGSLICKCDIPCPLFCCTLGCRNCKWTPKTWCGPLLEVGACYCACCQVDKEHYGIRLMNNFGIALLMLSLSFQIAFYVI